MMDLANQLRDNVAFRGAAGDLCAGTLRLSPQELAKIVLETAGQTPARAREILAGFLRPPVAVAPLVEPAPAPPAKPTPEDQLAEFLEASDARLMHREA
jgi:hypothetical protein